jgi:hypothetical protein
LTRRFTNGFSGNAQLGLAVSPPPAAASPRQRHVVVDPNDILPSPSSSAFEALSLAEVRATRRERADSVGSDRTVLQDDLEDDRTTERSQTPRPGSQNLPLVPTSLTACCKLLKAQAHVNLYDWWSIRSEVEDKVEEIKKRKGTTALTKEEEEEVYGALRDLVFPSARQMIK